MSSPDLPAIDLMHPTQVARPFHRAGWVYEEKYDGWRMLARKHGRDVRIVSRAGRDHTRRFPALVAAVARLAPPTLILARGKLGRIFQLADAVMNALRFGSKVQTLGFAD